MTWYIITIKWLNKKFSTSDVRKLRRRVIWFRVISVVYSMENVCNVRVLRWKGRKIGRNNYYRHSFPECNIFNRETVITFQFHVPCAMLLFLFNWIIPHWQKINKKDKRPLLNINPQRSIDRVWKSNFGHGS